ncbi:aminotransferase class IV [Cellulophaga baltica]|uniref:aminotransferase class IV n=1 Tax=Cellulophaga TaxID=104264 RepID=UPI001C07A6B9|nr:MULTISPECIES: aminotransferase class IV [Cellulophaga]MBU2997333.1 aminotransferase class IV [Cellulophaga baltica]MDO6768731.1 aminotransferase class IV [Cellulophaga sp. 1_MG-2023]
MLNFNGELLQNNINFINQENRGLRYGDSLFETIRVVNNKIYFWEDHYLRLMASMRILRMEIPMNFTMEYLEGQILETIEVNSLGNAPVRVRFTVYRNNGGLYTPTDNNVSFIIEAKELDAPFFMINESDYEVELFKDFYVNNDMLSTLKTNNRVINVVGSIYANENNYQNCILLNNQKMVVEVLNGNLFMVVGNVIKTPAKAEGCVNGILRKKIIEIVGKLDNYTLEETTISPFELQKADELFITNAIVGIQPVTKYRKKKYVNTVAKDLAGKLNTAVRLG